MADWQNKLNLVDLFIKYEQQQIGAAVVAKSVKERLETLIENIKLPTPNKEYIDLAP